MDLPIYFNYNGITNYFKYQVFKDYVIDYFRNNHKDNESEVDKLKPVLKDILDTVVIRNDNEIKTSYDNGFLIAFSLVFAVFLVYLIWSYLKYECKNIISIEEKVNKSSKAFVNLIKSSILQKVGSINNYLLEDMFRKGQQNYDDKEEIVIAVKDLTCYIDEGIILSRHEIEEESERQKVKEYEDQKYAFSQEDEFPKHVADDDELLKTINNNSNNNKNISESHQNLGDEIEILRSTTDEIEILRSITKINNLPKLSHKIYLHCPNDDDGDDDINECDKIEILSPKVNSNEVDVNSNEVDVNSNESKSYQPSLIPIRERKALKLKKENTNFFENSNEVKSKMNNKIYGKVRRNEENPVDNIGGGPGNGIFSNRKFKKLSNVTSGSTISSIKSNGMQQNQKTNKIRDRNDLNNSIGGVNVTSYKFR